MAMAELVQMAVRVGARVTWFAARCAIAIGESMLRTLDPDETAFVGSVNAEAAPCSRVAKASSIGQLQCDGLCAGG
jgi:hypothetical protein